MANDNKDKTCHYCNKKGHIAPEYRKKQRDKAEGVDVSKNGKGKPNQSNNSKGLKGKGKGKKNSKQRASYWCDHCQTTSHSTDYCRAQQQSTYETPSDKGKGKGKNPSAKGKVRGQGWSKGNFPRDYYGSYANVAPDNQSETYSSNHSHYQNSWADESTPDLGFMILHNDPSDDSSNLPRLYQILIHWEPFYAPFPITVRADMTVDDVINTLSVTLQISKLYLFLFLDFRKLNLRRRLDEIPVVGPGATLILKRWSLQQDLQWSEAYRVLSTLEAKTFYWNFNTLTFQPARPESTQPQSSSDNSTYYDIFASTK